MKTIAYNNNHERIYGPGGEIDYDDPITLLEMMADDMDGLDDIFVDEADIDKVPEGFAFRTYPSELHLELPPNNHLQGIWKWEWNGKKYRGNMRFDQKSGHLRLRYVKRIYEPLPVPTLPKKWM